MFIALLSEVTAPPKSYELINRKKYKYEPTEYDRKTRRTNPIKKTERKRSEINKKQKELTNENSK